MKRLMLPIFLALALALSGCSAGSGAPSAGGSSPAAVPTAEMPEVSVPTAARPAEDRALTETADSPAGAASYTVERQDRSVRSSSGAVSLFWYYDLVQLTGDTPEVQDVNDSLSAHCEEFFARDVSAPPPERELSMEWRNTAEAAVTENGDGLLSVRMDTDWYMGGVYNSNCRGYTYDLATGKALGLADLTGQDPDTLATTLREIVKAYMAGQPEAGWWDDAADKVDGRSLEDMIFWVDGGEIVLCFDTYDLTIGAYGPVIIPTGVMAERGID